MGTKIPAAQRRLFKNVFICKRCSHKMRTDPIRIVQKQVACRACGGRIFRPVKAKKK